jgi:hypothetical protein
MGTCVLCFRYNRQMENVTKQNKRKTLVNLLNNVNAEKEDNAFCMITRSKCVWRIVCVMAVGVLYAV